MHVTLHCGVVKLQSKLKDALNELFKKSLSTLTAHAAELPQHQYTHLRQHCYTYTHALCFLQSMYVHEFKACEVL